MRKMNTLSLILPTSLLLTLGACQTQPISSPPSKTQIKTTYTPSVTPALSYDSGLESKISSILKNMSLEQKIGQMIQVRIGDATLKEIEDYGIGSVLNGGGQTPDDNANSTAAEWASYADKMYQASLMKNETNAGIPIMWGTDAVHGHNNVQGAVLYPHNIALGAANNPELIRQIAEATALSVAATGIDWNFSPTVAAARDYRWGRTYESFSEDPTLVSTLGAQVVEGLQGQANTSEFLDQNHVLATAKHYIGDGGTAYGDDQGYTHGDSEELLKLHLPGYLAALESGVQTIMASYNFWNGTHSHASKALLTDLLKTQLKFDGLVVSDWQAIAHIPGCTLDSCPEAINAGVDIFMIPKAPDWQNFYRNTIEQVNNGDIAMTRIDDAVSRILRVKMRAGLWDKPSPANRIASGKQSIIGSKKHRDLAQQAVRESLVLLKNDGVLPIAPNQTILVAGAAANNISMQSGGWSVTWQGLDNKNEQYVGATSIYKGIANTVEAAGGKVILSESGSTDENAKIAIVVFGETPYAEMNGDIQNLETLEFERQNKQSLKLIKKLKNQGMRVVAVFLSGRPMWMNKELNAADAFVSAWLPGSEGQGIADVLFQKPDGSVNYDFKGKLSFSWPNKPCDAALNMGEPDYNPLYPNGYGLTYSSPSQQWNTLNETTKDWAYGCRLGNTLPKVETITFDADNEWFFYAGKESLEQVLVDQKVTIGAITAQIDKTRDNAIKASWDGSEEGRLDLRNSINNNEYLDMLANNSAVVFDIKLKELGEKPMKAGLYSGHLGGNTIDIHKLLSELNVGEWSTLSIDLRCFTNIRADMNKITIPFGLHSKGIHKLSVSNVRYQPEKATTASISCQK